LKKQIKQAITDHPKVAAAVIVGLTGEATEYLLNPELTGVFDA
jgi:hypothetical protein